MCQLALLSPLRHDFESCAPSVQRAPCKNGCDETWWNNRRPVTRIMSSSLRRTFHIFHELDKSWQILLVASRITSRSATEGGNCGLLAVVMPCNGASCAIYSKVTTIPTVRTGWSFCVIILPHAHIRRKHHDKGRTHRCTTVFSLTKSNFIDFRGLASSCAWRRRATNSFKSTRPLPWIQTWVRSLCHTFLGDSIRSLTFWESERKQFWWHRGMLMFP